MGFDQKLKYLSLTNAHTDIVVPSLQCFTNLEFFTIPSLKEPPQGHVMYIFSAKVHMPRLRSFDVPRRFFSNLRDQVLEAPLLDDSGHSDEPISQDILLEEYGPQYKEQ